MKDLELIRESTNKEQMNNSNKGVTQVFSPIQIIDLQLIPESTNIRQMNDL